MSLLLIPALILVSGAGLISKKGTGDKKSLIEKILSRLSGLIINYPGRILLVSAVVILFCPQGFSQNKYKSGKLLFAQAPDKAGFGNYKLKIRRITVNFRYDKGRYKRSGNNAKD